MRKHGLTADEVAAPTTMIVEDKLDDFTKDLARVVSKAAGLTSVWNKHGEIAFAGLPITVAAAAEVYTELRNRAYAGTTMPAFALPLPPQAGLAWRAFYLAGFANAVEKGLAAAEKAMGKKPPPPPAASDLPIDWGDDNKPKEPEVLKPQAERSPAKEMLGFYNAYSDQGTVKWICDFAYAAGEEAGLSASRGVRFEGQQRKDEPTGEDDDLKRPPLRRLFLGGR